MSHLPLPLRLPNDYYKASYKRELQLLRPWARKQDTPVGPFRQPTKETLKERRDRDDVPHGSDGALRRSIILKLTLLRNLYRWVSG